MLPESRKKCRGIAFRRFIAAQKSSSEKRLAWKRSLPANFRAKLEPGTVLVASRPMKKVKTHNRKSATQGCNAAKNSVAPKNVEEYLARVPEPARSTLNKIRAAIRSAAPPDAAETISYRMPAFKYKGLLVWFAAFSEH